MSAIYFDVSEYILSHGAAPRGRGSWAFHYGNPEAEPVWVQGSLLYSEARRIAAQEARARGVRTVYVAT